MSFEPLFSLANTAAMAGWIALIVLPRRNWLITVLRFGLIAALALAYSVLIFVYFFRVEGGGFNSIIEVRTLFASDPVLLAGWLHYLAFDLFIGTWIALEADRRGYHRLLQAPILVATFMFGPFGLLSFYLIRATEMALGRERATT